MRMFRIEFFLRIRFLFFVSWVDILNCTQSKKFLGRRDCGWAFILQQTKLGVLGQFFFSNWGFLDSFFFQKKFKCATDFWRVISLLWCCLKYSVHTDFWRKILSVATLVLFCSFRLVKWTNIFCRFRKASMICIFRMQSARMGPNRRRLSRVHL